MTFPPPLLSPDPDSESEIEIETGDRRTGPAAYSPYRPRTAS